MSHTNQMGNENDDECNDVKTNSNTTHTPEKYSQTQKDAQIEQNQTLKAEISKQKQQGSWWGDWVRLSEHNEKISQYEKKFEELNSQQTEASKWVEEAQRRNHGLKMDLETYKSQLAQNKKESTSVWNTYMGNKKKISQYKKENEELKLQQAKTCKLVENLNQTLQKQEEENVRNQTILIATISQLKGIISKQKNENVRNQTSLRDTISKQQNEKKYMKMFLLLSWICLPVLIGVLVYVQYADCINGNMENNIRNNFNVDLQNLSETIQKLNGLNTNLQHEKREIEQAYKENVAVYEEKLDALENHISEINKLHENDMRQKNLNYNNLAEECRMCQTKVRKINDLERDIEEISNKMKDCNVDYDYCELEKAQMIKLGETHQLEMAAKNKQLSECHAKL